MQQNVDSSSTPVDELPRCIWCGAPYAAQRLTCALEAAHLRICPVYQCRPADMVEDGKEYLLAPGTINVYVRRYRTEWN